MAQLLNIQRNSKLETRFHPKMGCLITRVTYIRKTFWGIPVQTVHKYRETYYGEIKDCEECKTAQLKPSY